ncbi:hypothetical protein DYH09_12355 [bacterium CPR1]|nr:hypothetical protein [bacterium CPR1]
MLQSWGRVGLVSPGGRLAAPGSGLPLALHHLVGPQLGGRQRAGLLLGLLQARDGRLQPGRQLGVALLLARQPGLHHGRLPGPDHRPVIALAIEIAMMDRILAPVGFRRDGGVGRCREIKNCSLSLRSNRV